MTVLRDAGGGALPVLTCNELAAAVGITWAGLSKWLAGRPRYRPLFTIEKGTRVEMQLWAVHTADEIRKERES